jgi:hypothetical protein
LLNKKHTPTQDTSPKIYIYIYRERERERERESNIPMKVGRVAIELGVSFEALHFFFFLALAIHSICLSLKYSSPYRKQKGRNFWFEKKKKRRKGAGQCSAVQ